MNWTEQRKKEVEDWLAALDDGDRAEALELVKAQRHELWSDRHGAYGGMPQPPERLGRSARVYPRAPVADWGDVCWWDVVDITDEPTNVPVGTGASSFGRGKKPPNSAWRQVGPTNLWPKRQDGSPDIEKVEQLIDSLAPDLQECFHLLYGEGLKVAAAARRAGVSRQTMFARRKRLKRAVEEGGLRFAQVGGRKAPSNRLPG